MLRMRLILRVLTRSIQKHEQKEKTKFITLDSRTDSDRNLLFEKFELNRKLLNYQLILSGSHPSYDRFNKLFCWAQECYIDNPGCLNPCLIEDFEANYIEKAHEPGLKTWLCKLIACRNRRYSDLEMYNTLRDLFLRVYGLWYRWGKIFPGYLLCYA